MTHGRQSLNRRGTQSQLPGWARCTLAIVPLGDRRTDVESDLAELFRGRIERYGGVYAHRRLLSDIVSLQRGTSRGLTMLQDLRFAARLFRKHPIPLGITIGGLALAIGVVTSVFSIVNASMLRQYGMDDPASVVSVSVGGHDGWPYWPYTLFLQMREQSQLTTVEASLRERVRFSVVPADDGAATRQALFVSGGYLHTLGGRPSLGRALQPSDDAIGAPAVAVVSHHLWSTQLNRDQHVIGRTVWLNGSPVTLVGVLQPDFTGPVKIRPSIWAPLAAVDEVLARRAFDASTRTSVEVVARLAPDTSVNAAQENLTAIVKRSSPPASPGDSHSSAGVQLYRAASPMDRANAAESYVAFASIFGVVGLVLALACANTANLLLAGASTRMREIGIRIALGSTKGRLVRQMISESLLLGLTAGGLGFLLAIWLVPLLGAMLELSPELDVAPDGRVLLFAVSVALACGVAAGISPARHGARGDVLSALKAQSSSDTRTAVPSRLRTSFVGFQAAVSMLLLVAAALLARTAVLMTRADIGFDADRILAASFSAPRSGFDEPAYVQAALAALRDVPSVERASVTQYQPFGFSIERDRFTHGGRSYTMYVQRTDADYFATAGIRILRGRAFTAEEVARETPVALISEQVARAFFGESDPIGRSVSELPAEGERQAPASIIGVTADAITARLRTESHGTIYRPISQQRANPPSVIVRTASPGRAAPAVEDALRRIDPRVRVETSIVREGLDAYLGEKQMLAWLAGPTAILALVLAALGVYGVTAFTVSQRTQEVSVRVAIGATTADVLRLLVADSLRPVVIGLVAGLAAALVVSRIFAAYLSGISPHDPLAIGLAAATLLATALVAVGAPARRAARTDPASVLRQV